MEAISLFVKPHPVLRDAVEELIRTDSIGYKHVNLPAGQFLFREGELARHTYYIRKGLVRLYSDSVGGTSKTVFFHKAGSLIGFQRFQRLSENWPSISNARTTTTCDIFAIDADAFAEHLRHHGDVCYAMSEYLFEQLAMEVRESVNTVTFSILQRFTALLLQLSQEFNLVDAPAIVPFTNAELAEMLGVHPNSITNSVMTLRNAGCVDRQRNCLVILDFDKLRTIAESLLPENGDAS